MAHTHITAHEPSSDFRRQLDGYGLTTAQILYRLPDHPLLLQTYVWQDYDLCPRNPRGERRIPPALIRPSGVTLVPRGRN